ncbi:YraN family protein [Moheibacter sediminis]|uniref:UPF0102 protein SAMN06296427_10388 n=1 Tax=Moheibacter sediminis TaxID=1434700 RepID=A0A1W1ZNG5_9FLAO|nr:YraN family protein [Moheibacter sediminis]SMC49611.1 putative endonuclease [Moheibacter sediminis]
MASHNDFGKEAEVFAAQYLVKNNYKILDKNYRFGKAEIDIIAIDESKNELVIVEVKSLFSDNLKNPEESVNKAKRKLLIKAADEYITSNSILLETRFDIISLVIQHSEWKINHIRNAFMAYE